MAAPRQLLIAAIALCIPLLLLADDPAPATAPTLAPDVAPEIRLLRSQNAALLHEVAQLKQDNASLRSQLTAAGLDPGPSTQPAATNTKPHRVVIVFDHRYPGADHVRAAVAELEPDQWFNIVVPSGQGAMPMSRVLLQATPANRQKIDAFLSSQAGIIGSATSREALLAAFQYGPDAIYFIAYECADKTIEEARRANHGINARINTTTAVAPSWHQGICHNLWQLAHDSGGVCVDDKGNPIDEPPLSIAPKTDPPPKPATKPSIFKLKPRTPGSKRNPIPDITALYASLACDSPFAVFAISVVT